MKRIPKVFLFSPPFSVLPAPLLGVPLLRGYLNQHGIECMSADLNVRFLRWLITNRNILDSLIEKAIEEFKMIQKSEALTQNDMNHFLHQVSVLAIAPPDLIKKHLGSRAIFGFANDNYSDSWIGHLPRILNALAFTGLFTGDSEEKIKTPTKQDSFMLRYNALEQFFNTSEITQILKQAAASTIVGISIPFFSQQAIAGSLIAQYIRKLNKDVFIIFGGSGLSQNVEIFKQTFFDTKIVDAVGLYEGELTLRRLAECIADRKKINNVPNLLLFDLATKEFIQTDYKACPNLDDLAAPIFNIEELKIYSQLFGEWHQGIRIPLIISRGCWWDKCAYCSDKQVRHPKTKPYQCRKPTLLVDDIEKMQTIYDVDYFYLITSAMAPNWGLKFAKQIIKRGITAKFWTYMRATNEQIANNDFFHYLQKAGFDMITVGVESTVDNVLSAINKGNTHNDIVNTIQGICNAGIRTKFNLIADLPPSTLDDVQSNWHFIIDNLSYIHQLTVFDYLL